MKKLILGLVLLFGLSSFGLEAFSAEDMVYIDLFEVFSKYKKTEDYDKVLEGQQSEKEKDLESIKSEIDKLQEEFKLLKESEKDSKKKEIEDKASDFDSKRREAFLDLKKDRDEKMKEILEDIEKVVEQYAKKNRVRLVLKKAAVAYGDPGLDRTKEIITLLNKDYKK
ncbi:MAG: OmpH family outer membrane protein [Candidatus Omnitrophica bacterium]|nr:OmpH family outer membrane protein [Candidatus Omnitrophota bacterium]